MPSSSGATKRRRRQSGPGNNVFVPQKNVFVPQTTAFVPQTTVFVPQMTVCVPQMTASRPSSLPFPIRAFQDGRQVPNTTKTKLPRCKKVTIAEN
jgi:hypothetical protein